MKPDDVFSLDDAPWPALLTDASGSIRRANQAAILRFGAALEKQPSLLGSLWAEKNSLTVEQFLAAARKNAAVPVSVRLAFNKGDSYACLAVISLAGPESFLIQLLPEAAPGAVEARGAPADAGYALKQKLDCALQLARTISLDFNNALTGVLGHASLILSKMEPGHPWRQSLLEVEKAAARAAELSNDLASFSRQERDTREQATGSLNAPVQRCVEFFQRNPGPDKVEWKLQLERNLFACKFDSLKLQQAFLRVIENSLQAFRGPGRIVIHSRNVELQEPAQDRNVRLAAGAHVCMEISDNGCGIEPDVLPKLFEPFFTTKRDKKHRGLGLAWVYGIVTNHGGGVAVSSQPGKGTSVRIYLPADKALVTQAAVPYENLNGSQTVLVVDDEELILTMSQAILADHGYKVLTAMSGQQALDVLSKAAVAVDVVVTDLIMPGVSGRELVEAIQRTFPGVRIICMSGYPWPAPQLKNLPFIQKPFTAQDLLLRLKEAVSEA